MGLEQYADSQYDDLLQEQMKADFQVCFIRKDRDYWIETLSAKDTCVAPVLSVAEVSENEHLQARGSFNQASYPGVDDFSQLAPILAGTEKHTETVDLPAGNITNTEQILAAAGYEVADIATLIENGIIE